MFKGPQKCTTAKWRGTMRIHSPCFLIPSASQTSENQQKLLAASASYGRHAHLCLRTQKQARVPSQISCCNHGRGSPNFCWPQHSAVNFPFNKSLLSNHKCYLKWIFQILLLIYNSPLRSSYITHDSAFHSLIATVLEDYLGTEPFISFSRN